MNYVQSTYLNTSLIEEIMNNQVWTPVSHIQQLKFLLRQKMIPSKKKKNEFTHMEFVFYYMGWRVNLLVLLIKN